jgi:hypothetical protein
MMRKIKLDFIQVMKYWIIEILKIKKKIYGNFIKIK